MADDHDGKISALVDGELPREEVAPLFDQLKRDKTSQVCWHHYHLISDALKNNLPDKLPEDFVKRVSQALEAEAFFSITPRRSVKHSSFHKPTIGFALAASVAAVAFVGLGWHNQIAVEQSPSLAMNATPMTASTDQTTPMAISANQSTPMAVSTNQTVSPAVSYSKVNGRQWDVEQPAVISKLNGYLLSHDQFSSMAVMHNGVLPQVRIVGYERAESIQQDPAMNDNGR